MFYGQVCCTEFESHHTYDWTKADSAKRDCEDVRMHHKGRLATTLEEACLLFLLWKMNESNGPI